MNTEIIKGILSLLVVIGVGVCLWLLFCYPLPQGSRDIILIVIGALVATFKDIYGYYFGSSEGSTRKTEILTGGTGGNSGRARIAMLMLLAGLCSLMFFSGCATTESAQSIAAKSLLSTRAAIITSAQAADDLCTQGIMKQADCDKALELYKQGQAAYNAASDGFLLYLETGALTDEAQFEALRSRLSNINSDLTAVLQSFTGGAK